MAGLKIFFISGHKIDDVNDLPGNAGVARFNGSFPEFRGRGWSDLAGEISVCTKSFTHTLTAISLDWRRFILPKNRRTTKIKLWFLFCTFKPMYSV